MYNKEFFEKRSTGKVWSKTSGFSERLRALRKLKGYSQEEVSEKLGLAKATYGTYENGKYSPDAEKIAKMADFFNVSADYLLGMEDINDNSQVERRKSIKKELKTISLEFETIIKETQKKYFKQIEEILKKEMI